MRCGVRDDSLKNARKMIRRVFGIRRIRSSVAGGTALREWTGGVKNRLKSRLWLGVPVVGGVTFAVSVLLVLWFGEMEISRVLLRSALVAVLLAGSWGLGVWSATAPDDPGTAEEETPDPAWMRRIPLRLRQVVTWGLVAAWVALLFSGEIEAWIDGSRSAAYALGRTVFKILMICMVVIPIVLVERRKR